MGTRRRTLLTTGSGSAAGAALATLFGTDTVEAKRLPVVSLKKRIGETTSICPFCAVGCGLIAAGENGRILNVEGDPDHPINLGSVCSKGAAVGQVANSDRRLTHVLYRAPGASEWETKSWDWALDTIAERIKATRDATWIETDSEGRRANRTETIATLGGAALDNEECYLLAKAMRSLGIVYLEHQARI